jgi:hypothetical protein
MDWTSALGTVVVWLIVHLPGWAWVALLALAALTLFRRAPLLSILGIGGGLLFGRSAIRASHSNPMKLAFVVIVGCAAIGIAVGNGGGGSSTAAQPTLSTVAGPGGAYTYAQMEQALESKGMAPGNARVGAAVGETESGGRSNALCDSCSGVREYSVGPWQFNLYAHPDVTVACAEDLSCAAGVADRISKHGMDWGAWSTYTSGAYLAHLEAA